MKVDEKQYYSNPYLPDNRAAKGEKLSMIRATLLFCLTILSSVVVVTFFNQQQDRFIVVPQNEGMYIFDRKTSATNYCNSEGCKAISLEFLAPKQILIAQIPGVSENVAPTAPAQVPAMTTPQPQPQAQSFVNPNFSMPGMNNQGQQPVINQAPPQGMGMNNQPGFGPQQAPVMDPMAEGNDMGGMGPQQPQRRPNF